MWALVGPLAVHDGACGDRLGHRLGGRRGEGRRWWGGTQGDVRQGAEGARVGRRLLGRRQRGGLGGEAGGAVGRGGEVRVPMVLRGMEGFACR